MRILTVYCLLSTGIDSTYNPIDEGWDEKNVIFQNIFRIDVYLCSRKQPLTGDKLGFGTMHYFNSLKQSSIAIPPPLKSERASETLICATVRHDSCPAVARAFLINHR